MKNVKVKQYSKTKTKKLIKDFDGEKLQGGEFNESKFFECYVLNDGRLILVDSFEGIGVEYPSIDSYVNLVKSLKEQQKNDESRHILTDILENNGLNFSNDLDMYINRLKEGLSLLNSDFDYSFESLQKIDAQLNSLDRSIVVSKYYAPLIAYTGEVLRKACLGEWKLFKQEGEDIWEPYIVNDGKTYNPFLDLFKEFNEADTISVYSVTLSEYHKYTLSDPPRQCQLVAGAVMQQ